MNKPKQRGRPPKNPSKHHDTKQALIRSGVEMLTERGYMTSDIDSILKKVGIPKGSFYYYFKSKEEFGYALLDSYASYFAYKLNKYLTNPTINPLERIELFYQDTIKSIQKYHFERGCLIGNLGQEITTLPEGYRTRLNEIFIEWQQLLSTCLKAAQNRGEIHKDANCYTLAVFFWTGWEGAVMRTKLLKNIEPLTIFFESFITALPR